MITKNYGPYKVELIAYFENLRRYYEGEPEPNTVAWFLKNIKSDWVVIDAGAHIGYYSLLFAHLARKGRVYAFEASPVTLEKMLINFGHNGAPWRIEPICMALGDTVGVDMEEALSFSGQGTQQMQTIFTEPFDFTTIDRFCSKRRLARLDLIKIDVDGWDLEVLYGARKAINGYRPAIVVEVGDMLPFHGHTERDVSAFVEEIKYTATVLDEHPGNWLLLPRKV